MERLPHALALLALLFALQESDGTVAAQTSDRAVLSNARVQVELVQRGGRWSERYSALSAQGWLPLLVSGHPLRPDPSWRRDARLVSGGYDELAVHPPASGVQSADLILHDGPHTITKRIELRDDDPFVHVTLSVDVHGKTAMEFLLGTYSSLVVPEADTAVHRPEFVFSPQLRPEADDVIGDHVFRSPVLMVQHGSHVAALVPDPDLMNGRNPRIRTSADLRTDAGPRALLAYGVMPWEKRAHVYYRHTDSMTVAVRDSTVSCGYYLYVRADAPPREGYRDAVRFLWERFGRRAFDDPRGPQSEPFRSYVHKAWDEFVPRVALETTYEGQPVTLLRQARLAWSNALDTSANNDAWFNVWFNSLRTAYGMALHARATGNAELKRQAEGVLNLALLAPQHDGIAPSIFTLDGSGGHWVADHAWGGIRKGTFYSMFHNAWTCTWLLFWADLFPSRRQEIMEFTGRFARFLISRQHDNGVISSWYAPVTLEPAEEFRDENAETAGAALFLAEYAGRTGDPEALRASRLAMNYIVSAILPEQKWFDFETFFSCSRKPLGFFDRYTGQHPQNTLSMHQAAEALLTLSRVTKDDAYRRNGEAILDYLSLYQQVWSPRWLSCELFGGFGVQNTDGEWSDSRQGYFAVTYFNYFAVTGRREYFERGVAALRAMFSLFESPDSPRTAENYAHASSDQLAGVTGLHWGTGSSVVSIHVITERYGDAYVHLPGSWGGGVDGCRVNGVRVAADTVTVSVADAVSSPRTIRLVFGEPDGHPYTVIVNGKNLGRFDPAALQKGVRCEL